MEKTIEDFEKDLNKIDTAINSLSHSRSSYDQILDAVKSLLSVLRSYEATIKQFVSKQEDSLKGLQQSQDNINNMNNIFSQSVNTSLSHIDSQIATLKEIGDKIEKSSKDTIETNKKFFEEHKRTSKRRFFILLTVISVVAVIALIGLFI